MKEMTLVERKAYIQAVADGVAQGKLSLGDAAKRLREDVLGLSQERFAMACKISKRTLSQLEVDSGNPTVATLDAVFKKFGLKISLAHLNPVDLNAATAKKNKAGLGIPTVTRARPPSPPSDLIKAR
ncbi:MULTISPECIES: helix-turn-helix transcriptional regulator [unclassified Pseudomonas]|uniref:helix-turn-helix domain-containing protein n=1 Tax=unclassified Pseudomonas TaxID=196821 RepID=UPI001FF09535|nr:MULTISPECIES: helix-turn-helix transcriptional regulator [unclassified Pseudomonas]